jgi:hypothetical protein
VKLLLVSTSAGAGHTRAAQALEETARLSFPEVTVRHVDILDFVDRAYRKAYADGYLAMVDRAPELWGHFYKASDRVPREGLRRKLVRGGAELGLRPRSRSWSKGARPRLAPVQAGIPALESGAACADEGGRPRGGKAARRRGDPFPHAPPLKVISHASRGR